MRFTGDKMNRKEAFALADQLNPPPNVEAPHPYGVMQQNGEYHVVDFRTKKIINARLLHKQVKCSACKKVMPESDWNQHKCPRVKNLTNAQLVDQLIKSGGAPAKDRAKLLAELNRKKK